MQQLYWHYNFCFISSKGLLSQMKIDHNNISVRNNWKMYNMFLKKLIEPRKKAKIIT